MKEADGNMIAEINCFDYAWKCLYVGALCVKEEYRKSGLGSKLLTDLEAVARKYEVQLIHLDTFDFQALDFYLKHGYEVYGVLDKCHKRYNLNKVLE
ncbi:GNAT family N-acetyltransferase [Paenibacillus sp. chi10]|uniref:GNAT family N-acetyltransferase n=1 Tax=Paenibacillus suaedae TaxID=3077233 RepID=A0AAJ2JWW5_9BACL|nr:GNAT family N-acetyltransferase [Paenibacillus sp. chi10]MDT8975727.1 GNAT family N-acetyltransferase [Paenibacillus sp. chi10]